MIIEADRALLPDISWVYHLYYGVFKAHFGESSTSEALCDTLRKKGV